MIECIHELAVDSCNYCRPRQRRAADPVVFISPQRVGHLEGCTHKEDDDWNLWGEARYPGAWRDLCNRRPITADAGATIGIVAERACQTCVASDLNS